MLETQDRQLFLEALKPPPGYTIDRIIGTSYSLDPLALLTVPLSFTITDWQDEQGKPRLDPLALLEAMRRYAGRLSLFCQGGLIQVPQRHRAVYAYLENSIIEVNAHSEEGVFHPKVWVCRYTSQSQEEPIHYKVLVQSRNMTFDRSWDVLLVLDGNLDDRKNAYSLNHPLGNFVQALPRMAIRPVTEDIHQTVELLQYEIRRVSFHVPAPFEAIKFWPLGIPGHRDWPFNERMDRTLIISPFVSGPFLQKLGDQGNNHMLVTREDSLSALQPGHLERYKTLYALHDSGLPEISDESVNSAEDEEDHEASAQHEGLHAKVYVSDAGWDANVWIGSANATVHGFEKNVEFLVQLQGKKSRCGVDAVLGNPDQKGSLIRILKEQALPEEVMSQEELERKQVEKQLEMIRKTISSADFAIHVEREQDWFYLKLELPKELTWAPKEAQIRCWPISAREEAASQKLSYGQADSVTFGPVAAGGITSFFAFEVGLPLGDKQETIRFLCNFPLHGAPDDRMNLLMRELLKNRDEVLRYLMLLLGDEGVLNGMMDTLVKDEKPSSIGEVQGLGLSIPLFEMLMRTLQRNPARLDSIQELVESLQHTEDGLALLPEGFMTMWTPIWQARKGMGL